MKTFIILPFTLSVLLTSVFIYVSSGFAVAFGFDRDLGIFTCRNYFLFGIILPAIGSFIFLLPKDFRAFFQGAFNMTYIQKVWKRGSEFEQFLLGTFFYLFLSIYLLVTWRFLRLSNTGDGNVILFQIKDFFAIFLFAFVVRIVTSPPNKFK